LFKLRILASFSGTRSGNKDPLLIFVRILLIFLFIASGVELFCLPIKRFILKIAREYYNWKLECKIDNKSLL